MLYYATPYPSQRDASCVCKMRNQFYHRLNCRQDCALDFRHMIVGIWIGSMMALCGYLGMQANCLVYYTVLLAWCIGRCVGWSGCSSSRGVEEFPRVIQQVKDLSSVGFSLCARSCRKQGACRIWIRLVANCQASIVECEMDKASGRVICGI